MDVRQVPLPGTTLEAFDWGRGEPILFIQTGLVADELLPVAQHPALDGYRKVLYHRRGYAGSSPTEGAGSIERDAADAAALLAELGLDRTHVVGLSFSGAIGLQLAADHPEMVASLALLEPPPVHVPSADEFRAASDELLAARRERGEQVALDDFLTRVVGPGWRDADDGQLVGATEQMEHDAGTFFDTDLPALLAWEFGPEDVARVDCPVLHIGGTDSGAWFAEVRELILAWFPAAADVVIEDADHTLALTHVPDVADALRRFFGSHAI